GRTACTADVGAGSVRLHNRVTARPDIDIAARAIGAAYIAIGEQADIAGNITGGDREIAGDRGGRQRCRGLNGARQVDRLSKEADIAPGRDVAAGNAASCGAIGEKRDRRSRVDRIEGDDLAEGRDVAARTRIAE